MKKEIFVFLFIFLIYSACAFCETNQIDINSASAEELDNLSGIGPSKADAIINNRPFKNIDDLLIVNGIGESTLQQIKNQGLACVGDFFGKKEENLSEEGMEFFEEMGGDSTEVLDNSENIPEPAVINLSPQSIKTAALSENSTKTYAVYGIVFFCFLLCALFLFKSLLNGKYKKNEFRE